MKFKVGDRIIGKDHNPYPVTGGGWRGEVAGLPADGLLLVRALPGYAGGTSVFEVVADWFDLDPDSIRANSETKIVVTTDGTMTTARLYDGKSVVRSAEAKCSPKDTFDFKTGAALAVDRLLGRDAKETEASAANAKSFSITHLSSGRFGCTNRGKWFVVVEGRLVYVENGNGWDDIADLNADGSFKSGHRIEFVVDAYSPSIAKHRARTGNYIWQRNK